MFTQVARRLHECGMKRGGSGSEPDLETGRNEGDTGIGMGIALKGREQTKQETVHED